MTEKLGNDLAAEILILTLKEFRKYKGKMEKGDYEILEKLFVEILDRILGRPVEPTGIKG